MAYASELVQRAGAEAWSSVIGSPIPALVGAGFVLLSYLWFMRRLHGEEAMRGEIRTAIVVALATATVFLVVFVVNVFVATPSRIVAHERREVAVRDAEIAKLRAILFPAIRVYMRWPESWFWDGRRYPQDAQIELNESALLEMTTRSPQRMDPMAFAPPTQRLSNIVVFLTFSREVLPLVCDPTRPQLAIWTPSGNNTFYSVIEHPINPGIGGNVEEAFCFAVENPGQLGVTYTFSPAETAPVRGRFNIIAKERLAP
jgi:hypothetical protein